MSCGINSICLSYALRISSIISVRGIIGHRHTSRRILRIISSIAIGILGSDNDRSHFLFLRPLFTFFLQHSIGINKPQRVVKRVSVGRPSSGSLRHGIDHAPTCYCRIIHPCTIIEPVQTKRVLKLFAVVEVLLIEGVLSLKRVEPQSKRIVIILLYRYPFNVLDCQIIEVNRLSYFVFVAYIDVNIAWLPDLCNETHAITAAYRRIPCYLAICINLVKAEVVGNVIFIKKYIVEESFDGCIRLFRVISGSD